MTATVTDPRQEQSLRVLLWLVAVGFFMQTLDATIVNTALPAMARSLGESPLRMQSVIVAYSLTMAMLIPASGWMADRFGTRRVYVGAIVLFVIGSLLCALSPSLSMLVAARVVQGAGGALLLPVGRLVVLKTFPRERFLHAMSFVAIPGLIGPLIGPTLGGWLVEVMSWHWIFLINLPVGIVGALATLRYMPTPPSAAVARFDAAGYLLLAFGMVAISLALDGLSGLGLHQASVLVLMIFGLSSLTAYWLHALRRPDPLFSPQLFRVGSLRIGLLGNLFSRLGSSCMPFLIPLLLQVAMGYSPAQAGMMMLPVAIASMSMKRMTTPLITRHGYRRVLVVNTGLVGLMMASFVFASPGQPLLLRILQLALFGAVNSMQFTAMNTLTLKDLGPETASSGNSLLSMVQMLAMGMGVAAAGAVLAAFTDFFGGGGAQTLDAFRATFGCMALITIASAGIFWQLAPQDSRAGVARREPEAQA
ncbi:multidrug transporter subunit MdtD [Roseateles saccharophilus]|uniref:EmrB/QacA subfamily drug resistance transporter n=1 Tax=Roseateles saccharophilus TaxID=304 RepID=A0A4V2VSD2_ROSSA|nr:multidrug transporter subunit MdtD [Roseateles saccharophilus]MDG0834414.1 DHA2 family efflux MFS transporter permease subunit [Roseateles saccharophilus]TCV02020.1 EmrB/QacA subfamily drug resistance transporter [Roseateles saccharophilus]